MRMMGNMLWRGVLVGMLLVALAACSRPDPSPSDEDATPSAETALAITYTPPASAELPTATPLSPFSPTDAVPTPSPEIPFDATVVEMRMRIPAIGLDRRLQGNVAGDLIMVDETTGSAVQRNNQPGINIQLQQILAGLDLAPVPEGCLSCVEITYSLPFEDVAGSGWLRDERLLASIENYFAISLDGHFPPGTLVGLRRSASPYAPAHTLALTADGLLWRWLATDDEIAPPVDASLVAPGLSAGYSALAATELEDNYVVVCDGGVPIEELYLALGAEPQRINVVCPEFAMPASVQPLYTALDGASAELLARVNGPEKPPAAFPLNAVVDYQREDDTRITIFQDGLVEAVSPRGVITTTLTFSEVLSLTTPLLASGRLSTDLSDFRVDSEVEPSADPVLLLVRGEEGVYDGRFATSAERLLAPLNALVNRLLGTNTPQPTPTPISN